MPRKMNETRNLADELVAAGMVDEARRNELAEYLACRERFLGRFGDRNPALTTVEKHRRGVADLEETLKRTERSLAEYQDFLQELTSGDLRVLLKSDSSTLDRINLAVRSLRDLPPLGPGLKQEAYAAACFLEAHERINHLLAAVREKLSPVGGAEGVRR